jgi:uncharacterized membrane protein
MKQLMPFWKISLSIIIIIIIIIIITVLLSLNFVHCLIATEHFKNTTFLKLTLSCPQVREGKMS